MSGRVQDPRKQPAPPRPKSGAKWKSFLRFYHSEDLREKTLAVLTALEQSPEPEKHRDALADIVVQLTNTGMDYYFMRQLMQAKPGFIIRQSATLGMAGALQVLGAVLRNIIGRMNKPQLLSA